MNYHLIGLISSFFVLLSLGGIAAQLKLISKRKKQFLKGDLQDEQPTSILSLNRFTTSFLAFFAMFLYGLTLEQFNHYIVWPRAVALLLLLAILYEIQNDRRDMISRFIFICGFGVVIPSVILAATEYRITVYHSGFPHALVVITICLFFQGAVHQILKIRRSGRTGGLSLQMHQLFFAKDISSVAFGFVMQLDKGWPIIFAHGVSLFVQLMTMWHFRWVRVNPIAQERRARPAKEGS